MKSIAVVIVSWPEFEQKACEIAAEICPQADTLLVLHDGPRGQSAGNAGDWIQFPSGSYFGPKFEWAIKNINADVLLLIVATLGVKTGAVSSRGVAVPSAPMRTLLCGHPS